MTKQRLGAWAIAGVSALAGCSGDDATGDDGGAASTDTGAATDGSSSVAATSAATWDTDPGCLDGGCTTGNVGGSDTGGPPDLPGLNPATCSVELEGCAPDTLCSGPPTCSSLLVTLDDAGVATLNSADVAICMLEKLAANLWSSHELEISHPDGSVEHLRFEQIGVAQLAVTRSMTVDGGCDASTLTVREPKPASYFDDCLMAAMAATDDELYQCLIDPVTDTCVATPTCEWL